MLDYVLNNYVKFTPLNFKGNSCNVTKVNDKYIVRSTNYTFINPYYKNKYKLDRHIWFNNTLWTDNLLFDKNFNLIKKIDVSTNHNKLASGKEDIRIINWNNHNYGLYTTCIIPFWKYDMYFFELDSDYKIINEKKIQTNNNKEKNWQPIENMPYKCVYSYKPFKLIDLNTGKFIEINNKFNDNYRGSTPIIKYKTYNVGIIHKRLENPKQHYLHYFVIFDEKMNLIKVTKPFSFIGADIEFCTYIKNDNNTLEILMSVNDQITLKFEIQENVMDLIFNDKLTDKTIFNNLYDNLYYIAKENDNTLTSICLATYSNNENILSEAIMLNHNCSLKLDKKMIIQKILLDAYNHLK